MVDKASNDSFMSSTHWP